jgi:hypothetical protein
MDNDPLDALRRLHTVVSNHNTTLGYCFCCGSVPCQPECAVRNADATLDEAGPEFPANWNSPVPHYDPKEDGDYSAWLVSNNID